MKLERVTQSNILYLNDEECHTPPTPAHRYQINGILSMPKLNLKPIGKKMPFLMEV